LGRSRGGFGTKLHVVCDSDGWLVAVLVSPGQVHESTQFENLMESIEVRSLRGPAKRRPARIVGDKAYSAGHIREWLSTHRIEDVIPHRDNEAGRAGPFDRDSYRSRNIIERTIGWLKEFRRVATRYEKLAVHYLGMIKLGMILQYLTY
jgi:transposase